MTAGQAAQGVRVAIGHSVYDAADTAALTAAVADYNERQRLPGLEDSFNPTVIDPAKLTALLAALSPETVQALAGRPLSLNTLGLGIALGSPTRVVAFTAPLTLALGAESGGTVTATARIAVDCTAAASHAAAARTITLKADAEVRAGHGDTMPAQLRRYAAARVWADSAAAHATCAPGDKAAKADRAAAEKAAQDAIILGGSMD